MIQEATNVYLHDKFIHWHSLMDGNGDNLSCSEKQFWRWFIFKIWTFTVMLCLICYGQSHIQASRIKIKGYLKVMYSQHPSTCKYIISDDGKVKIMSQIYEFSCSWWKWINITLQPLGAEIFKVKVLLKIINQKIMNFHNYAVTSIYWYCWLLFHRV